ncbi:MAG: DJ-1/PfpI family protein [Spirochaetaceae bacterium]|nr:DJ-1/PfpI family protein [Spirochaetaceae bacterium]
MKVLVLLAEGFEEIEALTPVDYLRRAGAEVTLAAISGRSESTSGRSESSKKVTGSHKITVEADCRIADVNASEFDMVICPGGMPGSSNIAASAKAADVIRKINSKNGFVAAICAAPVVVLAPLGLLKEKKFTCYPGMENAIEQFVGQNWKELTAGATHSKDRVVQDGKTITAGGPGVAEEFALKLVEVFFGSDKTGELRKGIVAR